MLPLNNVFYYLFYKDKCLNDNQVVFHNKNVIDDIQHKLKHVKNAAGTVKSFIHSSLALIKRSIEPNSEIRKSHDALKTNTVVALQAMRNSLKSLTTFLKFLVVKSVFLFSAVAKFVKEVAIPASKNILVSSKKTITSIFQAARESKEKFDVFVRENKHRLHEVGRFIKSTSSKFREFMYAVKSIFGRRQLAIAAN